MKDKKNTEQIIEKNILILNFDYGGFMKKLAIWGWWQGNNLGDNWIKNILSLAFPDAIFIDTTIMSFEGYGFVICGGGGLFIRDVIKPWSNYSQQIPYGMLGLGAEFKHKNDLALHLKNNAEFFYLRDQYSLQCMNITDIDRSYDVTFYKPLRIIPIDSLNTDKLCFIWRDGKDLADNYKDFNEYIIYEENYSSYINILESNFSEIIENDFQTNSHDINKIICDCGFIISGRYHGIVAAIQKGIPCIAIDICPKIRALMTECGLEKYCIKVNQVEKLDYLIKQAKVEIEDIRKQQQQYVYNANKVITQHICQAKEIIKSKLV